MVETPKSLKPLKQHFTIAKSAGSISLGEIIGLILAIVVFYAGGKLRIPEKFRFPLALLVIFIFCMLF